MALVKFGTRLRELREQIGKRIGENYSQPQLLDAMGQLIEKHHVKLTKLGADTERIEDGKPFTVPTLSRYENGEATPSRKRILLLAYFFSDRGVITSAEANQLLTLCKYSSLDLELEQPLLFGASSSTDQTVGATTNTSVPPIIEASLQNISEFEDKHTSYPEHQIKSKPPTPFVNQDLLLDQLFEALLPGHIVCLWGTYGIGKTAIALELRRRATVKPIVHFEDSPRYIDLSKSPGHEAFLLTFANELDSASQARPENTIRTALRSSNGIIILDGKPNWSHQEIRELQNYVEKNALLITSRSGIQGASRSIPVPLLEEKNAYKLVTDIIKRHSNLEKPAIPDSQSMKPIFEGVGYLPFVIELLAHMLAKHISINELIERLEQPTLGQFDLLLNDQDIDKKNTIAAAIATCVPDAPPSAHKILGQATIFDFFPFHKSMLVDVQEEQGGFTRDEITMALEVLVMRGLLNRTLEEEYEFASVLVYLYARDYIGMSITDTVAKQMAASILRSLEANKEKSDKWFEHTLAALTKWVSIGIWIDTTGITDFIFKCDLSRKPILRKALLDVGMKNQELRANAARNKNDRESQNERAKWLYRSASYHIDCGEESIAISELEEAKRLVDKGLVYERNLVAQIESNLVAAHLKRNDPQKTLDLIEKYDDVSDGKADPEAVCHRLNNFGRAYLQCGEVLKSISCFDKALKLAQDEHLDRHEMVIECGLGDAFSKHGDMKVALEHYESAIRIAGKKRDCLQNLVVYLGKAGNSYSRNLQRDKARRCFTRALRIAAGKLKDSDLAALQRRYLATLKPKREGNRLRTINSLGFEASSIDGSKYKSVELDLLQQKLTVARSTDDTYSQLLLLIDIGNYLRLSWKINEAILRYRQALTIVREIQDERIEGLLCRTLGRLHHFIGESTLALKYYGEALEIAQQLYDYRNQVICCTEIGTVHTELGNMEDALEKQNEALSIARQKDYRPEKGLVQNGLAVIHYYQGDYRQAEYRDAKALVSARKSGEKAAELEVLISLAHILIASGKYELSMSQSQSALEIAKQIGNQGGECRLINCLGDAHFSCSQVEKAQEFYEKAHRIAAEIRDRRTESESIGNLGKILSIGKQWDEAIDHLTLGVVIAREIGHRRLEAIHLTSLGDVYRASGNIRNAESNWHQALKIFKSINSPYAADVSQKLSELSPTKT